MNYRSLSGTLLFLAGFIALMGIITGEIYYPSGYTTGDSEISDLGSTRPPEALIYQPSATIFNATMILVGILTILGASAAFRSSWDRYSSLLVGLLGAGILGVGIFPGNVAILHPLFPCLPSSLGGLQRSSRSGPSPARTASSLSPLERSR